MKSKFLIVLCILLGALIIGCTTTTGTVDYTNKGKFGDVSTFPLKDFTASGLVFTETTLITKQKSSLFNGNTGSVEGEGFIYQALLKEAQKLGADTIINVTIDKKVETVISGTTFPPLGIGLKLSGETTIQTTYYGSALAIKYATLLTNGSVITTTTDGGNVTTNKGGGPLFDISSSSESSASSGGNASAIDEPKGFLGFLKKITDPITKLFKK